ncbi:MAG: hypothetical protein ACXWLH_04860 [Candidatus Saccharimonadales bacterium]
MMSYISADALSTTEVLGVEPLGPEIIATKNFLDIYYSPEADYPAGTISITGSFGYEVSATAQVSAEKLRQADQLIDAMAEKFGVDAKHFNIFAKLPDHLDNALPSGGEPRFFVAYAAGEGLELPVALEDMFDKKVRDTFELEVDGKKYDTRQAMTYSNYRSMAKQIESATSRVAGDKYTLPKPDEFDNIGPASKFYGPDYWDIVGVGATYSTFEGSLTVLTGENPFVEKLIGLRKEILPKAAGFIIRTVYGNEGLNTFDIHRGVSLIVVGKKDGVYFGDSYVPFKSNNQQSGLEAYLKWRPAVELDI